MADVLTPSAVPVAHTEPQVVSAKELRATVLSIAWKTWVRSFRNNTGKTIMTVIFTLMGLPYLGIVGAGAVALSTMPAATAHTIFVLLTAVLTIMWWLGSLIYLGQGQAVEPRRFALMPVTGKQLLLPLFLAAFVSIPTVFTAVLGLFSTFAWIRHPVALLASIVGWALGVIFVVGSMQAVMAAASAIMSTRRSKERTQIVISLLTMCMAGSGYLISLIPKAFGSNVGTLEQAQQIAAWASYLPWAAPWALGGDVAQGHYVDALLHLIISVAAIAAVAWWWTRSIERSLAAAIVSGSGSKVRSRGGIPRWAGKGPVGALRWRCMIAYVRDPRQRMALFTLPLLPVFLIMPSLTMGSNVAFGAVFGTIFLSVVMPSSLASSFGYDGSSVWMQTVSGMRGRDEVWGRLSATLFLMSPLLVLISAITLIWARLDPAQVMCALAVIIGLGGCGYGVQAWRMARFPYALPPPGANVFASQNQGGAAVGNLVSMLLQTACALPTIVLCIVALFVPVVAPIALVVAIISATLAIVLGVRAGGDDLERRWPDVFARVSVKID